MTGPRVAARLARGERRFRLTGLGVFDGLFRAGRRRQGRWIELVVAPAQRVPGRAGLVVGRRVLPLAVDRNRMKRKLREALRRARPAIESHDLVVRLKRPAPGPELDAAVEEATVMIGELLARPSGLTERVPTR